MNFLQNLIADESKLIHYIFHPTLISIDEKKITTNRELFGKIAITCDQFKKTCEVSDHKDSSDNKNFKFDHYGKHPLRPYLDKMIYYFLEANYLFNDAYFLPTQSAIKTQVPSKIAENLKINLEKQKKIIELVEAILQISRQAEAFIVETTFFLKVISNESLLCFKPQNFWDEQPISDLHNDHSSFQAICSYLRKLIAHVNDEYKNYEKAPITHLHERIKLLISASKNLLNFMLYVLRFTVNTHSSKPSDISSFSLKLILKKQEIIQKIKPTLPGWVNKMKTWFNDKSQGIINELASECSRYVLYEQNYFSLIIPLLTSLYITDISSNKQTAFNLVINKTLENLKEIQLRQRFIFSLLYFLLTIQLEIPYQQNLIKEIEAGVYKNYLKELSETQQFLITTYHGVIEGSYASDFKNFLKNLKKIQPSSKGEMDEKLILRLDTSETELKKISNTLSEDNTQNLTQLQSVYPISTLDKRQGENYYLIINIIARFIESLRTNHSQSSIEFQKLITDLKSLIEEEQRIFTDNTGLMSKVFFQYIKQFSLNHQENPEIVLPTLDSKDTLILEKNLAQLNDSRKKELTAVIEARTSLADFFQLIFAEESKEKSESTNFKENTNNEFDEKDSTLVPQFTNDLAFFYNSTLHYAPMDAKDLTTKLSPQIAIDFLHLGSDHKSPLSYQELIVHLLQALDRIAMRESIFFKQIPIIAELIIQALLLLGFSHRQNEQPSTENSLNSEDDVDEICLANALSIEKTRSQFGYYLYAVIKEQCSTSYFYHWLNLQFDSEEEIMARLRFNAIINYKFCLGVILFTEWVKPKPHLSTSLARLFNIHLIKMPNIVILDFTKINLTDQLKACRQQLLLLASKQDEEAVTHVGGDEIPLLRRKKPPKLTFDINKRFLKSFKILLTIHWETLPPEKEFKLFTDDSNEMKPITDWHTAVSGITGGQDLCDLMMQTLSSDLFNLAKKYGLTSKLLGSSKASKSKIINLAFKLLQNCWASYLLWDPNRISSEAQRKIGWLLELPIELSSKSKLLNLIIKTIPLLNTNIHSLVPSMLEKFSSTRDTTSAYKLIQLYVFTLSNSIILNSQNILDWLYANKAITHKHRVNQLLDLLIISTITLAPYFQSNNLSLTLIICQYLNNKFFLEPSNEKSDNKFSSTRRNSEHNLFKLDEKKLLPRSISTSKLELNKLFSLKF